MSEVTESQVPILRPLWLHPTGSRVSSVAVNNDVLLSGHHPTLSRDLCAFGTDDGKIKILETKSGRVIFRFEATIDLFGVTSLDFSEENFHLAAGYEDGSFRLFDYTSGIIEAEKNSGELSDDAVAGKVVFEKKFPKQMVEKVKWQPRSSQVFLIVGKSCFRFDTADEELTQFAEEESSITDFLITSLPQSGPVLMLTCYGHLKVYQIQTGRQVEDFQWKGSLINLIMCPNKKYVVCGTQEQTIHIWNLKQKKDLEMRGFAQKIKQMSFREDGLQMAHGSGEEIVVWDFSGQGPAGKRPSIFGPHEKKVTESWYQNHGQLLASAGQDGVILLWSQNQPDTPIAISGIRDQEITKMKWTSDDQHLFVGFSTGYVVSIPVPSL